MAVHDMALSIFLMSQGNLRVGRNILPPRLCGACQAYPKCGSQCDRTISGYSGPPPGHQKIIARFLSLAIHTFVTCMGHLLLPKLWIKERHDEVNEATRPTFDFNWPSGIVGPVRGFTTR